MTQQVGVKHASVKDLIALRDNRIPPARRAVVEGMWAHEIVLGSPARVETFFWCEELTTSTRVRQVAEAISSRADRTLHISPKVLEKVSERTKPDGLVSVVELPEHDVSHLDRPVRTGKDGRGRPDGQGRPDGEGRPDGQGRPDGKGRPDGRLVVVADGLEIPGNLGTLIRTMDAVAADALLCVNRRVRLTHPKVFRASHGMVLHVPVLDFASVPELAAWLDERGFTVYTLDVYAGDDPLDTPWSDGVAVVLGNERYGTTKEWESVPQRKVRLPMLGHADSLNVSVAGSIVMFHARARMSRSGGSRVQGQ